MSNMVTAPAKASFGHQPEQRAASSLFETSITMLPLFVTSRVAVLTCDPYVTLLVAVCYVTFVYDLHLFTAALLFPMHGLFSGNTFLAISPSGISAGKHLFGRVITIIHPCVRELY